MDRPSKGLTSVQQSRPTGASGLHSEACNCGTLFFASGAIQRVRPRIVRGTPAPHAPNKAWLPAITQLGENERKRGDGHLTAKFAFLADSNCMP